MGTDNKEIQAENKNDKPLEAVDNTLKNEDADGDGIEGQQEARDIDAFNEHGNTGLMGKGVDLDAANNESWTIT